MCTWTVRYQEGYITADGTTVEISDRSDLRSINDPEMEARNLTERARLRGERLTPYGNGVEQVEDVRSRQDFAALSVAKIWRRVTFEESR